MAIQEHDILAHLKEAQERIDACYRELQRAYSILECVQQNHEKELEKIYGKRSDA